MAIGFAVISLFHFITCLPYALVVTARESLSLGHCDVSEATHCDVMRCQHFRCVVTVTSPTVSFIYSIDKSFALARGLQTMAIRVKLRWRVNARFAGTQLIHFIVRLSLNSTIPFFPR